MIGVRSEDVSIVLARPDIHFLPAWSGQELRSDASRSVKEGEMQASK